MTLQISLFAMLRQRAGRDSVTVELPEGATVAEALAVICSAHPELAEVVSSTRLVLAVNKAYATPETTIASGDELALIPPVSGGAPEQPGAGEAVRPAAASAGARNESARRRSAGPRQPHARVHEGEIDRGELARLVRSRHTGAVVTFEGVTRDVERLDYEAYMPMAQERIGEILSDVMAAHEVEGAAAEHRIGQVPLGEASVVVAVAAAHRQQAFAAAREAIDRIKAEAPIWKREVEGARARWVQGVPPPTGG